MGNFVAGMRDGLEESVLSSPQHEPGLPVMGTHEKDR
jgi:hypothetical protein